MMNRPQRSGWPTLLTTPVAVIDRREYDVLIADRELLSTAFVRQRIRTILGVFTFVISAALVGFVGGFWVGQHTHDESFKAACSRVVDEALRSAKPQRSRVVRIEDVAAGPVHEVSQ
jgi:nitrate/TMAO reductase-like tetraheme cytochrome c subunit